MKKIIITLTDKQHDVISQEMQRCQEINANEETSSGMEFTLSTTDDGILAFLEFKMYNKIDIGDVDWEII